MQDCVSLNGPCEFSRLNLFWKTRSWVERGAERNVLEGTHSPVANFFSSLASVKTYFYNWQLKSKFCKATFARTFDYKDIFTFQILPINCRILIDFYSYVYLVNSAGNHLNEGDDIKKKFEESLDECLVHRGFHKKYKVYYAILKLYDKKWLNSVRGRYRTQDL